MPRRKGSGRSELYTAGIQRLKSLYLWDLACQSPCLHPDEIRSIRATAAQLLGGADPVGHCPLSCLSATQSFTVLSLLPAIATRIATFSNSPPSCGAGRFRPYRHHPCRGWLRQFSMNILLFDQFTDGGWRYFTSACPPQIGWKCRPDASQ